MKTFTSIVATAALFTAATAAGQTVKLETTPCLQSVALESFDIPFDTIVVKELKSVCGLKTVSTTITPATEAAKVQCQAYKDAEGKQLGSAQFNSTTPALISTNPVQIGSIKCSSPKPPPADKVSTTTVGAGTPLSTSSASSVASGAPAPGATGGAGGAPANGTTPATPSNPPASTPSGSSAGRAGLNFGAAVVALGVAVAAL